MEKPKTNGVNFSFTAKRIYGVEIAQPYPEPKNEYLENI
jgi:hypothetical protein